jgi:hypothetical protein
VVLEVMPATTRGKRIAELCAFVAHCFKQPQRLVALEQNEASLVLDRAHLVGGMKSIRADAQTRYSVKFKVF